MNRTTVNGHATAEIPTTAPIAIVEKAVRLPGDIRSTDDFWDLLLSKKDVSSEIPKECFNVGAFYSSFRPP